MNKKKTIILLIIGILVVTTMSIGVTYSFMLPKVEKEDNQTDIGINNCAKITLEDNNSTINLKNTYPMEEEMGLQTDAYEFTISSTCEEYTGFNLYILTYEENEISDDLIRYGITSKNDTLLETNLITKEEASDITDEEKNEINQGVNKEYKKIYKVYSNNIPLKGESEYKLHIWIDEKAENDTMGESIKLGVVVKGYSREETLAEYLIKNKDNTLIYHDGLPDYEGEENSELEAGDNSYRYSGASEEVNNYICFGAETCSETENYDNLYRIIGLFKNNLNLYELKLIKTEGSSVYELGGNEVEGGAYHSLYSNLNDDSNKENYKGTNWDNLEAYSWNSTDREHITYNDNSNVSMWKESNLNIKNLNQFFYNKIEPIYQDIIVSHAWEVGGSSNFENAKEVYRSELGENKLTKDSNSCYTQDGLYALNHQSRICNQDNDLLFNANIGLMYISDYMYGTLPNYWNILANNYNQEEVKNNNWLYLGINEWTISRFAASDYGAGARFIDYTGFTNSIGNDVYNLYGIRPCFYLSAKTQKINGNGTSEDPYVLSMS